MPYRMHIGRAARRLRGSAPRGAPPPALEDAGLGARLAASPRAEAALARLGDKRIMTSADGRAWTMLGALRRDWVLLGDPYGPREAWGPLLTELGAQARAARARLCVYKADDAAFWRGMGWRLQPLGEEASLDLRAFDLGAPARRELRRKLAQARRAGLRVLRHAPGAAPLSRLAEVAQAWRAAHGGREMTFSMGHFDPAFLSAHDVHEARRGEATIAFVSTWRAGDGTEHMIDLMRTLPDAPNGTMHLLVADAIAAAVDAGAARFNLCMAPLSALPAAGPLSWALRMAYRRSDALQGLRRFKDAFRPDWAQRHMAAPGLAGLARGLLAARRLLTAPTPTIDVAGLRAAEAFLEADAALDETPQSRAARA